MQDRLSSRSPIARMPRTKMITGLSRSTVFDISNPNSPRYDPTFPKKVRIGLRAVGWFENELFQWLETKRT